MEEKYRMSHQDNIRRKIIDTAYHCGKGCHVGSALSVVDILTALFCSVDMSNNEVILSKGHAALAWYVTMNEFGLIPDETLTTFEENGSKLTVLAVKNEELSFRCSTGSLGQGMSVGVGMAIAMQRKNLLGNVYIVVGDGECNEGIVWEAAQLAGHHKLKNLCIIVDHNGFQSDGDSAKVIDLKHMSDLWKSNGFNTVEIEGHDVEKISSALRNEAENTAPKAIICKTIKGYGVSFMENSADWHYNRLTEEKYLLAVRELEGRNVG